MRKLTETEEGEITENGRTDILDDCCEAGRDHCCCAAELRGFFVAITETLRRFVRVEARNSREAERLVIDKWKNSEYVLDSDDFQGVEFAAVRVGEREVDDGS